MPEIASKPNTPHYRRIGIQPTRNQVTMTEPSLNILPRVATGDPAAVSECLDQYGNLVWSLAKRSIPNRQAAEDAVQEIFLKLWEVAGKYDADIASESTFIAMIARRKLIDISRKKSLPTSSVEAFDGFQGGETDVAEQLELNDEAAKAAALLQELPGDQQKVIKLSIYDGLSHSKIAEATGLSLGTVKTHIRRGILKLRQALFSNDYNGDSNMGTAVEEGMR